MRRFGWFVLFAFLPTPALALNPTGPTTNVLESEAVRFPDLAHDPVSDVWLVVSGQNGVRGRFLDANSAPSGTELTLAGAETYSPRVTYAPMLDGFVVCWLDEPNHLVQCRRVAGENLDEAITIDDPNTVEHLESAPDISCANDACLVTWAEFVTGGEIRARRLGPGLSPLGPVFTLSSAPGFDGFPSVDYVPARDEWLVVWTTEPANNQQTVAFARIPTTADATLGPPEAYWVNAGLNNYPEVACNPASGECLAITYFSQGNPDVWGCKLSADGTPGAAFAIAATPGFEGGDGIGLAFNTSTESWLAVFQGPETNGTPQEVFATEVTETPATQFQATESDGTKGVYQPRIAAHSSKPEFLVAMSVDYTHVGLQKLVGQAISLPMDAGSEAGVDAGSKADATPEPGRGGTEENGGCGCRVVRSRTPSSWLLSLLALGSLRSRARRLRPSSARARPRA